MGIWSQTPTEYTSEHLNFQIFWGSMSPNPLEAALAPAYMWLCLPTFFKFPTPLVNHMTFEDGYCVDA